MRVYAKIGTGPMVMIKIGWKRSPLKVGDRIKFKTILFPVQTHGEWRSGIIDGIKDVGHLLYLIARM